MSSKTMASSPRFFKIIMKTTLQDRKLTLPRKFVRNYGVFLPDSVCLKLHNGEEWTVKLTTVDGMVWLENGWHEFAEHYSLEFGSLLVFSYDSKSIFHTMIFDPAGLEIEYPSKDFHEHESKVAEEDKPDYSVEILDKFSQHPKKREKTPLPCNQPCKKTRNACSYGLKWEPEVEDNHNIRETGAEDGVARRKEPLSAIREAQAVQNPSVSRSENPGFKSVMRQSYIEGYKMMFPTEFSEAYLSKPDGMITIQTSDGRIRSILYRWSQGYAYVTSGWSNFVQENFLKTGDVCAFELIRKDTFLFTKEGSSSLQQDSKPVSQRASSSSTPNASETGNKFVPRNPFFEINVNAKSWNYGNAPIPPCFARKHFSRPPQTVKLQVGNKQWEVKLIQSVKSWMFSGGWRAFFKENSLENGDKCVFEMMSKKVSTFKVSIIKFDYDATR